MSRTLAPLTLALMWAGMPNWAQAAPPPAAKPASASAASARLVPASSEIAFTARQIGVPLEGRFKRFDAQIAFDPRQPAQGKVAFQIDLGSVSINPETDAELIQEAWFNTARFPKATFVSSAIKATGAGRFEVSGTLTIKGQSRPLVVPVTLTQAAGGLSTASGAFVLKRLEFKIGDGDWADPSVVANEVQVRFKLSLQGLPPL